MDSEKTDLQDLRKEIGDLRNEVIELRKELADSQKIILNTVKGFNGQHLQNYLVRLAGMQTAEFVVNNMNKTKVISDKRKYLQYVLSQIIPFGGVFRIWSFQGHNNKFNF